MEQILSLIPEVYQAQLRQYASQNLEEIRLAVGVPMLLRTEADEQFLWPQATQRQLEDVLHAACQQSIYAYAETLRQGYLTIEHGHRIGICGCGVVRNGEVVNLHTPSSIRIRIAHAVADCAKVLSSQLTGSVLIIGPPGCGKTTLLRDLVRQLSDKQRFRMGLVDERGEIAACRSGVPQLDVGVRTDIMDGIPKAEAIMMLLRTMSPQWIAVDEITTPADVRTMEQASFCGVRLIATAHCSSLQELRQRPLYQSLLLNRIFQLVVTMKMDKSYTLEEV